MPGAGATEVGGGELIELEHDLPASRPTSGERIEADRGAGAGPLPRCAVDRAGRRRGSASSAAASGSSVMATSRASARRSMSHRAPALLPGAKRTGDGARRRRLCAHDEPPRRVVCTTLDRPRATNMVTGAALATINRLPVLLLPGDIFARAAGPCPAAARGPVVPRRLGERRFRAGLALLGSHLAARAVVVAAVEGDARARRTGGDRGGDARLPAGRAGRGVRLPGFFRERCGTLGGRAGRRRAGARRSRDPRGAAAADRRRRRRDLLGGDDALRAFCERPAFRWARRRRARARSRTTIPRALGAIGATGTFAANRSPPRPTS